MKYLVYDLEFNQYNTDNIDDSIKEINSCKFEIIQIGAVLLDENFTILRKFNEYVKPNIYPTLHPYVEKLTGLTIEELTTGKSFLDVYNDFKTLFTDKDTILCVWGKADIRELVSNLKYYNVDLSHLPKEYIDIQHHATKYFKYSKGTTIGLKTAIETLSIDIDGDFHNAYYDALYTSKVFEKIYSVNIKPKPYTISKSTSRTNENKVLNTTKLYSQLEKIVNRDLTMEEKKLIKIAYLMGKTGQFQEKKS